MRRSFVAIAVVVGILAFSPTVRADHPELTVTIAGFAFDPFEVSMDEAGKAVWTNTDGASHTVSSLDGFFDSGTLGLGDSFTIEGNSLAPGTYPYQCTIHPRMTGVLVVTEGHSHGG